MRTIIFTHKLSPGLATKIKEQRTFATIFRKRNIASLFGLAAFLVPHGIDRLFCNGRPRLCYTGSQKTCTRNGKRIVIADSSMIGPIKKFFGFAKFSIRKFDLPSRCRLERRLILVISGIRYINDYCISIFKNAPTRNCSAFHI